MSDVFDTADPEEIEPARLRGRRGRDRRLAEAYERAQRERATRAPRERLAEASERARLPDLSPLPELLARTGELRALAERYAVAGNRRAGQALRHVTYATLPHGAKSFLAAALLRASGERLVWVARDAEIGDRVAEELVAWLGDPGAVLTLEPRTALAYERSELVQDETAARVAVLAAWHAGSADLPADRRGPARILVASVQALFQRTLSPDALPQSPLVLRPGGRIPQERLLRALIDLGYVAAIEVAGRGEFARRGGIVDLFPAGRPYPLRLEWFGDEVESIRAFDPTDQRGIGPVDEAVLLPASEFLLPAEGDRGAWLDARLGRLARRLPAALREDHARLAQGELDDAAEVWAGVVAPATALDHVGDPIWVLDEPAEISAATEFLWAQADERRRELESAGELPRGWPGAYPAPRDWRRLLHEARTLELTWETEADEAPPGGNPFGWHEPVLPPAPLGDLRRTVARWRGEEQRVVIASDQSARLSELLGEVDVVAAPLSRLAEAPPPGALALVERSLNGGFAGGPDGLTLITDRELFGSVRVRRPRALRRVVPRDILERLQPGDLVVHIDHGICRYAGLVRRPAGGLGAEERDFLELHFSGRDRMWVPVEQVDRVSRYAGGEHPALSRLGGGEWARAKARVRRAVGDLAKELLELYSARAKARGTAFSPDTPWQQEVEAAFPYEETPDQLRAADEVKLDMEREQPMDRLVVGDVGYGKTEVAIRAGFKAIQDGRQVAVLVPTTVLAQQHFATFGQRFAAYPIALRMLSRFVPRPEQQETVAGLGDGSVDLVIGTHRLLSRDIRFRNLGLVVVDEEQRFGVAHKERLKQLKREVDVLTLSATPIPRTLNMALAGVRDMSTIETPPEDRLPIQTRVAEASAGLVRDAILRELDRGGQVFFVHNRVETIEAQAEQLRRLLPQARIAVAHGQMAEGVLEPVMLTFARGESDVLVCTTIVESGLDIPNANTIVIDRADALGLAQLYQLRGRVGRSSRRAYCYLLYRRRDRVSEVARKRLQAIFNASELGAGFQIALADLEIRGAGNILGAEQSGHMAAVGFDLYTRLLADAVEEQKAVLEGRVPESARPATVVDLPLDAYLADDYVPEEAQKLELYRRLAKATDEAAVDRVRSELVDRFGAVPVPAERLLEVARLRIAAERAGIVSISREDHQLVVRFPPGWSRADTAHALAPASPDDPLRAVAGGFTYGSNQVRVRLPRDPAEAWAITRALVERLATAEIAA
ncbi:MAG TPA: transcription-repair coupling factor [Candidatus Limnocylindrales bacterium]|nr:transcription-repair coupling factor [Candidatus Limnocylindrales bacterium]